MNEIRREKPHGHRARVASSSPEPQSALYRRRWLVLPVAFVLVGAVFLAACGFDRSGSGASEEGGNTAYALILDEGGYTVFRLDLSTRSREPVVTLDSSGDAPSAMADSLVSRSEDRLYVAHAGTGGQGRLSVIDASTGLVVDTETVEHLPPIQMPKDYLFTASEDLVGIYQIEILGADASAESLRFYDPNTMMLLPGSVDLGQCGGEGFSFAVPGWTAAVVCLTAREVRLIRIDETGSLAEQATVRLPASTLSVADTNAQSDVIIAATPSPDQRELYVVTQIGRLFVVDLEQQTVVEEELPIGNNYISFHGAMLSPERDGLLVAIGQLGSYDGLRATRGAMLSLGDWQARSSAPLGTRATRLTRGPGSQALMVNAAETAVVVLDLKPEIRPAGTIPLPPGFLVDIETAAASAP